MLALHDVGEVGDAWLGRRGRGRGGSRDGRPAGQRGEVSRGVVDGLLGRMGQVALQDNVCISLRYAHWVIHAPVHGSQSIFVWERDGLDKLGIEQ